jgi:hypothetical protein
MAVELAVVHILVSALWSRFAAAIFSIISLATLAWTIAFVLSFRRLPVLVDEQGVTMKLGLLRSVRAPRAQIAGVRTRWPGEGLKGRAVLNLALINYPNVMLDLDPPLAARRGPVHAIAHCLDDPAGFVAAIGRLIRASGGEAQA